MSKSSVQGRLGQILQYTEFIVYATTIALASANADWPTRYALVALFSGSSAIIISRKTPWAATLLLSFPLLCIAHDPSNLYFAIASSVVAALTLFGPLKSAGLTPVTSSFLLAALTLGALGVNSSPLQALMKSRAVQGALNFPHSALILGASFKVAIQWLSMQFLVKGTTGSFDQTEAMLISQLVGAFIPGAIDGALHLSGSNAMAIVHFTSTLAWTCFWIYEFSTRLSQPRGTVLAASSALVVALAGVISPLALALPSKILAFASKDLNFGLIGLWLGVFAVYSVIIAAVKDKVSNTVIRKGFHFMALSMFLPAMILDPMFLRTALCLAIVIFVLLEFVRYSKILGRPVSDFLTNLMDKVTNERDRSGPVTTAHTYLLIGCGLPLIYLEETQAIKLALDMMAGPLLVLTFGDSFASIIGSKFGKRRWPSTTRTIEGTIAGIATTAGALYLLAVYSPLTVNWKAAMVSISLTFALEAYTSSIDNLVLPIFYFSATKLVSL